RTMKKRRGKERAPRPADSESRDREVRLLGEVLVAGTDFVSTATSELGLTYLNDRGKAMLGWPGDVDLSRKTVHDVHPAWARQIIIGQGIPEATRHGSWSGETAVIGGDGAEIPVSQLITAHYAEDGAVAFYSTVMRDISAWKRGQRELEAKTRAIENSVTATAIAAPDGTLTYVNAAFLKLWGEREAGAVLGRNAVSFWTNPEEAVAVMGAIARDDAWQGELDGVRADGSRFTAWLSAGVTRDASGEIETLLATFIDFTAFRRAEEELRRSENLLRATERISRSGSWEQDLRTGAVRWSPEIFRILRMDPDRDEASSAALMERGHPEDRAALETAFTEAVANRSEFDVLFRIVRPDGSVAHMEATGEIETGDSGEPVRSYGFMRDVSDREALLTELRSRAEVFSAYTKTTLEAFWRVSADARLIEVNDAACRMLGYDRDELLAMGVNELDVIESPEETARRMQKLAETGYDRFVSKHRRKDGAVIDVEVSATFVHSWTGTELFAFITDITQQKLVERLQIDRRAATEANNAKTAFLQSVTHELRTPLNLVLGFAQVLRTDGSFDHGQRDTLGEIEDAGRRMLALVNGILEYTTIESGLVELSLEPVDCGEIAEECLREARAFAGELAFELAFSCDCAGRPVARADRDRVRQVLLTLLSNAVKYNRPGGSVTVTVGGAEDTVRLAVSDTGVGIPEERREAVFGAFARLGREALDISGMGLGLAHAKRLVELMGGSIAFESEVDVGTTFTVELPGNKE
ncbi:MAG: PAS domain S-box protein, partial [Spirochaetaceae bacterium]